MNREILELAGSILKKDGLKSTYIDSVKIFKTTKNSPKQPLNYDFCLVFVLSGEKIGYLDEKFFKYNSQNYLVIPLTLPFECETRATEKEPFICILISIDRKMMYEIIESISKERDREFKSSELAVFSDSVTEDIESVIYRLLKISSSKEESKILKISILKELYYRIAVGKNSYFLHKMFLKDTNEGKISKALKEIHKNYKSSLDITKLAKSVDMSISSFHTHFKRVTSYTPLQYIKKVRLNRAKNLIAIHKYRVNETASKVGYESSSQFSRDFKNYFGYPPKEAKPSFEEFSIS